MVNGGRASGQPVLVFAATWCGGASGARFRSGSRPAACASARAVRGRVCPPQSPPGPRSPGSCACVQSRNRQFGASSVISANSTSMPKPASLNCSERMPGESITQPPPAMACSDRPVVVCRPLASLSRIAPVSCGKSWSGPASEFTSVDLPTPGGADQRHRLADAAPWLQGHGRASGRARVERHHGQVALQRRGLLAVGARVSGCVGLGQQDHRRRPGLIGQRQIAFEPRRIEVGIARGDDEQRVDIGGGELHAGRRMPLQNRPPIEPPMQRIAQRIDQHPVAHGVIAGAGMNR